MFYKSSYWIHYYILHKF